MVKAYLRYVYDDSIGQVSSSSACIICHNKNIITFSNEYILIINAKSGEIIKKIHKPNKHVNITYIELSNKKSSNLLAIGYEDGEVVLLEMGSFTFRASFDNHKSGITCIRFDQDDSKLMTASLDTSIIVWDIISESSLFKLTGHKNAITQIEPFKYKKEHSNIEYDLLFSSSKDGLFKIWDLNLSSSIATISSNSNEIWGFSVIKEKNLILLGTNSDLVSIIKLNIEYDPLSKIQNFYETLGTFNRDSFAKVNMMSFEGKNRLLYILTAQKSLEIYKYLNDEEIDKKLKRKKKRLREKQGPTPTEQTVNEEEFLKNICNRFSHISTLNLPRPAHSFSLLPNPKTSYGSLIFGFNNNNLATYQIIDDPESKGKIAMNEILSFEKLGHRSAVRTVALSSDDNMILSGSGENIKIWSLESNYQCLRTFKSGFCTCSLFLPKNRFFVVGEKEGVLRLFDFNKGEQIQELPAHEASIWSVTYHEKPAGWDNIVIVTGSADKKLKFWELVLNTTNKEELMLTEAKCLYMTDDIHCVKFSPDGRFYAVSLLDSTIKVFFSDSDKLFLTMYGHKLPVLSFDISSDGALLVSGSADKNVKLWGMDFGNCHKSIFAHNDSIMAVSFVKDTHYFFSASKDKSIKYWDGDTYQLILEFNENLGEVWCFSVSSIGDFFISGSNDRSIRIWKQNKDQVFITEEEEKRHEKMIVENYTKDKLEREEENEELANQEASKPLKEKYENLRFGEDIMMAIDLAENLREEYVQYENELIAFNKNKSLKMPEKPKNDKLGKKSIPEYVLYEISKINSADLEKSLKFLHLSYIEKLLNYIKYFIQNNIYVELCARILDYILITHETHIRNSKKMVNLLVKIQKYLRVQLQKEKDMMGFNLAGLKFLKKDIENLEGNHFEEEEIFKFNVDLK